MLCGDGVFCPRRLRRGSAAQRCGLCCCAGRVSRGRRHALGADRAAAQRSPTRTVRRVLAQGLLTPHDIWTRFRLAHEASNFRLAAHVAAMLPVAERPAPRDLDRLDRNPLAALSKGDFRFSSPAGRELALYALDRAAKNDAAAAREAWAKWRARVPEADRLD